MTQHQDATAAAVTVADDSGGLLMELEDYNCRAIAEALGHSSPHRL